MTTYGYNFLTVQADVDYVEILITVTGLKLVDHVTPSDSRSAQ